MSDRDSRTDDVITFGEIGSPETDTIYVPLGGRFQCPCGEVLGHDGYWLAAHWHVELFRRCERCRQRFVSLGETITLKGKPYGSEKPGW